MNGVASLPDHLKPEMNKQLEVLQAKDSIGMYNFMVERCFADCINSFRSKTLDESEKACVSKCSEKYIKLTQRVGFRFAEFNQVSRAARAVSPFLPVRPLTLGSRFFSPQAQMGKSRERRARFCFRD